MTETTSTDTAPAAEQGGRKHHVLRALNTPLGHLLRGRVTGPVHRRTKAEPEQRTELPVEAEGLIACVVKRTRLWPSEKREVDAELAAHFTDGYEAGHTTDELIESFGDPVRSAKLIRRAKRRCRPLWWQAMRYTRNAFAVFIGLYILLAGYLLLGDNRPEVNYLAKLNEGPRSVPEDQRAWPLYLEAGLGLKDDPLHEHHSALEENDRIDELPYPGEPGWAVVAAYLDDHAGVLDRIEQASRKPHLGWVYGRKPTEAERALFGITKKDATKYAFNWRDEWLSGILMPHLSSMRDQQTLILLRARRAALGAEPAKAVRHFDAAVRMAEHVHGPFIIDQLVSESLLVSTVEEVGRLLRRDAAAFGDGHLRDLAHRLASSERPFRVDYAKERYFVRDFLQRIYTDGWLGGGHVNAAGLRRLAKEGVFNSADNLLGGCGDEGAGGRTDDVMAADMVRVFGWPAAAMWIAPREQMERKLEELHRQMAMITDEPMWRWDAIWAEGPGAAEGFLVEAHDSPLRRLRYAPLVHLMPSPSRPAEIAEQGRARRDAILVAIALELHRRRAGTYPTSLDELTPHLLPEVPPDRFTGGPMKYVLRDGEPLLYSVGIDRDDDGGRLPAGRSEDTPTADRNEFACQWMPPNRWQKSKQDGELPDGDWILWPAPSQDG